ncbi:hypothetical protein HZA56_19910 [Candidatus Poribacteria bacterium]|nr:hypothetical protein [Candidatus Poribacteria bacterium]
MDIDSDMLETFQHMLGYSDEELAKWKADPRNTRVASLMPEFAKYRVVVEVLKSHGCVMNHKAGDKFYFTGSGALLCNEGPSHICAGALAPVMTFALRVLDKIGAGLDPTKYSFNRVRCVDVGLENGGWGEILMEVRVEKTD